MDRPESARPLGSRRTEYSRSTRGRTCCRSSASKSLKVSSTCFGWFRCTTWLLGTTITIGTAFLSAMQVVEDEVRPPVVDPVRGQLAAASHEVEHGVGLGAVVAGRSVDVELALAARDVGVIDVARHRAVRDVPGVVEGGAVPVHHELAVGRHGREGRVRVARVGDLHAVHVEVVGVDVRPERADRSGSRCRPRPS